MELKKLLFILLFISALLANQSKAQYVAIKDTGFGEYLSYTIPSCIIGSDTTGYQLDTTNSAVLSTTRIPTTPLGGGVVFDNFDGIQYFKSLQTIQLSHCIVHFRSTSVFPTTLTFLDFYESEINFDNGFNWPESLTKLYLYEDSLPSINNFPDSLIELYIYSNELTSIPPLPSTLVSLNVSDNPNLNCLPHLPATDTILNITNTNIQCLPNYPDDSFQNIAPLCSVSNPNQCALNLGIADVGEVNWQIRAYPNPAHNILQCDIIPYTDGMTIQVLDVLGDVMYQSPLQGSHTDIDSRKYGQGIYLIKVSDSAGKAAIRKIIID